MKCAIILLENIKQIMLTPESDQEKLALQMLKTEDDITVEKYFGTLYNDIDTPNYRGYQVDKSRAGYYRAYVDRESLMLVLKPKSGDTSTP